MVKPKGPKYRCLILRSGVIYIQKEKQATESPGHGWHEAAKGRWRFRRSCETTDWDDAAAIRDIWEGKEQALADGKPRLTFRQAAERYKEVRKPVYKDGVRAKGLAQTTWNDLSTYLREDGPLMGPFGGLLLDDISDDMLIEWWQSQTWKSLATGRQYVGVLSNIFKLAVASRPTWCDSRHDPVKPFRAWLHEQYRGHVKAVKVNPIEDPADVFEVVASAVDEGPATLAFVLLMLDAGLRQGEAMGLQWDDIGWGHGPDDRRRKLQVVRSLSRGTIRKEPKGKRTREVPLSRRLWWVLRKLRDQTQPGDTDYVVGKIEPASWRRREWARILKRAGMPFGKGSHTPKDLRDTFASHLLTVGVSLDRIKKYLGHKSVKVTEDHYAKYVSDEEVDDYRLLPGEVRPDFLSRLLGSPEGTPHHPPHPQNRHNEVPAMARHIVSVLEGKEMVELGGLEPPTLRLPA